MHSLLEEGLSYYHIQPVPSLCEKLHAYVALLQKWNKAYNLTAVIDTQAIIQTHLLDSLSIHSYINGPRCLDVGSGPGLPGLVLALVQTEYEWTLLDSNIKKVRFLRHVKTQLGIDNVAVIHSRVDDFEEAAGFSTIVCRAFSSLREFQQNCQHLLADDGQLLAMKANIDGQELQAVSAAVASVEKIDLDSFKKDRQRCLIRITRS